MYKLGLQQDLKHFKAFFRKYGCYQQRISPLQIINFQKLCNFFTFLCHKDRIQSWIRIWTWICRLRTADQIKQNERDPTGSGSKTLEYYIHEKEHLYIVLVP
jgi:hypothetical protein